MEYLNLLLILNKTDNTDIECNIQSNLKAIGLDVTGNINFTEKHNKRW